MHKILNVAPPSLRASGVKRAVALEPVVGRMLAKEPEERYASARELVDDLKKLAHGAGAVGKRSRRGNATRTIAVAVLLVGIGAAAFVAWKRQWRHPELKQRQLTSNYWNDPVTAGVISPDGRTLAVRLVLRGACAAHRALAGDPERLAAECASLALQSRGDVWIERVDVETERRQHASERRRERQSNVTEADDGDAHVVGKGRGSGAHRDASGRAERQV